jgi:hypothetical protein
MDQQQRIEALVDKVLEAVASPENGRRKARAPVISVGLEDPIASTKIFGFDANDFYGDPLLNLELQLRGKLWRWEHIPDDTPMTAEMPLFLSYYPEYTFLGIGVAFSAEGVPDIQQDHPMTRNPDVGLIPAVDFERSGWMPRLLEWYGRFNDILKGRLAVLFPDWGRGCLDIAVQLRGYAALMTDIVERPAFVHELLGALTVERIRWFGDLYRFMGRSPAPVGIADDWLNVPYITPGFFEEFVLPRYHEIERFHGGIASIHSCGNQTPLQPAMLRIRSLTFFEVSAWTDLAKTVATVPAQYTLGLSVHPNDVLVAPPAEIREKLTRFARLCRGRTWSMGTSGLTPLTADIGEFERRICRWIGIAREAFQG